MVVLTGLVLWGLSGSKLAFAEGEGVSLKHLRKLAIMENGRIKPLDTFAQNMLKQFSGQSSFQKKPAIQWLVRVLFTPEHTYNDKVFLITNPEVLDSINVERVGKARDRYSFSQLKEGLPILRQLAINASRIKENNRSFIENEIMTLYNKLYIFQQLLVSFQFLFPHPDFTVTDAETLKILNLPENKKHFSFFDMIERKRKLLELKTSIESKSRMEWTPAETNLLDILKRIAAWSNLYRDLPLTIIPAAKKGETEEKKWLSPWDILSPLGDGTIRKELKLIRDFVQAYVDNDQEQFDRAVIPFNRLILEQSGGQVREGAISLEVFYNQVDPFYKAKFFYGFSVLFLLLSFIMLKKWFYRLGFLLLAAGFLLHMFGTIARMHIMLRPPVTNLYETFTFTGLITVLLGIILELFKKRNIGIITGGLSGVVMLMIAGKYALEGDTMGMLVAVLDSNFWLASHVITIILGYAGIVLSGFIGHVYILQRIFRPGKKELLKNTFQAVYATQAFGIIFTFLGTVLGGIWADQSWGRFWGWDPKENGALLILLWSAILFHAKLANWIKETGMAFGTIIGVIAVSLAWFGVNLLGVGLHSYGFTSGVAKTLFIFILFELMFIFAGIFMLKAGKNHLKVKGNVKTFVK
jgi:ABC-type transport system involved in cytochrome c biogenesis permease subunit